MPTTQQTLQQARDADWVDYSTVTALKMTALRMAWKGFAQRDDEQMAAFRQFVAEQGDSLFWQAAFDALHAQQVKEDEMRWGWPAWPEMYQNVDSPEVRQFCEEHRDDVDFYLWLQWLAYSQFAACWEISQGYEMPIGLYRDLAVGVAEGGAETWCDRELYCLKASVGAPPDILGPLGQNWGLPPMDPHIITARAYEPFIELLRANMQNCGALRIDHVMSMLRLWWIPYGETADQGAYVHYPVDDLLSILALESKRHRCMVIGEDLGTVPVEIVGKLRSKLYCLKASVGAPPDILGPLGQNWGLPPMDPHIITARAYEPFIELLRANMQNCGALRIDHVMSMLRLWWIPYGETADQGAYVHYPVDDLLSILALESKRHRCMVIGEDLGTVPVEIVGKLRSSGVYSYKVLYFENDHEKTFRAPKAYPEQSMAVAATHDLPTLRGYWECGDLTLGKTLGLYPDEVVLRGLYQDRELAKQGLLDALHKYGCLPKRAGHKASLMSMTPTLNRGLQRYIADSNSALLGLQPEDWLDMAEPVNIPGTSYQYKNWRRKLSATLESMFADDGVNKLLKDLDRRRRAAAKKK